MLDEIRWDPRFANRRHAGRVLATRLRAYAGRDDVLVLGLPRGGVPVACEVAQALGAALDVFVVRKLGVPRQPELAMGAIASGGARVLNRMVIEGEDITDIIVNYLQAGTSEGAASKDSAHTSGAAHAKSPAL